MFLKKSLRWLLYFFGLVLAIMALAAIAIRFFIFPHINDYKNDIAQFATQTVGEKITIGQIVTGWDGISPQIILKSVDLYDAQNRVALHLNQVNTSLSWLSIPMLEPRFSELNIVKPELSIRRTSNGGLFVAGIDLAGKSRPESANWLLRQSEVMIENATVVWYDDMRQAPPLSLTQLNFLLSNPTLKGFFGQHQFSISALPSVGSNQKILIDGRFFGRDVSKIANWYGDIHAKVSNTDLAVWRPWLDYQVQNRALNIQSGMGDTEIWLAFTQLRIEEVKTRSKLSNLAILLPQHTSPLIAEHFSGELTWFNNKSVQRITAKQLQLKTNTGINIQNGSGQFLRTLRNKTPWIEANIHLDQLNLDAINLIAPYLNLTPSQLAQVNGLSPKGWLNETQLALSGPENAPNQYSIHTQFKQIGVNAYEKIPGFSNLTGSLTANEKSGELRLDANKSMLDLKGILRWPIPADKLTGKINWQVKAGKANIQAKDIFITSPHLTGTVNVRFDMQGSKGAHIDLNGKFSKGDAKYALFYYPISLGADTLHWLDTSILAGQVENVALTVKGAIADFPYAFANGAPNPALGQFKVSARLDNALLEYGTGWPVINHLGLDMLFEGTRMVLNANAGDILGTQIKKSVAVIPKLDADWPILSVKSVAVGQINDGIAFINKSPVKEVTLGFTDTLKANGSGTLLLDLSIPLQDSDNSIYKGEYKIVNGTLLANPEVGLPELSKVNGSLKFNEAGVFAQDMSTYALGGPAKFNLKTGKDKTIYINAKGRISDAGIKTLVNSNWADTLDGNTDWTGDITIKKPLADLVFKSNLVGLAVNLPAPFGKSAVQAQSFVFEKDQTSINSDDMHIRYGELFDADISRGLRGSEMVIDSGNIGINTGTRLAANQAKNSKGLYIKGKLENLNLDEWLSLNKQYGDNSNASSATSKSAIDITRADLSVQNLYFINRSIHQLKLSAQPNSQGVSMNISSNEVNGQADWLKEGNGKIVARLKNLSIPSSTSTAPALEAKTEIRKLSNIYPALDITADSFQLGNKVLGSLALNAFESDDVWVIQQLNITNPDSELQADGSWYNWTRNPNTNLKFALKVNNIGKTLKRFGQPDTVKGGEANVNGQLNWAGSPHEFETSGLSGHVELDARKGQFLKVQPGVGRLLGLLSLQSLPRRLTLDFRDLFSDGFAFDQISAKAEIHSGILRSDDFYMTGPAADVKIKGETNLKAETQRLKVNVKPNVSDTLSLAAFAGGPIAGVAAFVAQKLLKDPLNKIAGSEYDIAGTWSNPQEVKSDKESELKEQSNPLN
jgi:uncharacterized protein (TIGR02099 family)